MFKFTKTLAAVIVLIALAGGGLMASGGAYDAYKLTFGEPRWQVKYNNFVDAVASLGSLIANWVGTVDSLTLIQTTPSYSDNHTFTLTGNYTALLTANKRIVADCGADGLKPNTVASCTYAAPNSTVVVNISNLTSNLAAVSYYATRNGVNTYGSGDVVVGEYGAPSWAALQSAVTVANASGRRLLLTPGTWPLEDDLVTTAPVYPVPGAILTNAGATTKNLTINGSFEAGLYQIFSFSGTGKVVFGAGAVKEVHPEWWAINGSPGTTDMSAGCQAALNTGLKVKLAASVYNVTGLRNACNGQIVEGSGTAQTIVYCPAGYAFYNYTDADDVAGTDGVTVFKDLVYRDITFIGGQTIDASDYKTVLGTSKTLTTTDINGAFRFKRAHCTEINNCVIKNFHRGIDEYGGANLTVLHSRITECEVGWMATTGASWGDATWKAALNDIAHSEIFQCWYGINWISGTQFHMGASFSVYFCNTAMYLNGCVEGFLGNPDIEYCCEGINITGIYTDAITIDRPTFSTYTGDISGANAWGTGYSINVHGVASGSTIYVTNTPIIDGGGAYADSGRLIFDDSVRTNYPTKITPVVFNNFVYFKNIKNTMLYPDPSLTRHGVLIDHSTGIAVLTVEDDGEGNNALVAGGSSGGLAYNGLRMYCIPAGIVNPEVTTRLPLRVSYEYWYNGTNTIPHPFGPHIDGYTWIGASDITNTGGKWIAVSASAIQSGVIDNAVFASGGFDGTLKIRKIYFSYGYGMADSYSPDPAHGFITDGLPTSGSWMVGDTVKNITLAEAGSGGSKYVIKGWLRLTTGAANVLNTDWVQDRALTGN